MQCVYPCKIIAEKVGGYSVIFPDFAGGTQGETLYEALLMAEDFANFAVTSAIEDGEPLPAPTAWADIAFDATNTMISFIRVDTDEYAKKTAQPVKVGAA